MKQTNKTTVVMYVMSSVISLLIVAVIFGLAALVCGSQFGAYMKLVFIPFYAFFGGFFNNFFLKKCKYAMFIPLIICFLAYLIFVKLSFSVFGYFVLYAANWAIGVAIAFLVRSYKK